MNNILRKTTRSILPSTIRPERFELYQKSYQGNTEKLALLCVIIRAGGL